MDDKSYHEFLEQLRNSEQRGQAIAMEKRVINSNPNRNDINVYRSGSSGAKYGMKLE